MLLSKGRRGFAVEFKASAAPKLTKGFWTAFEDLDPDSGWVVIPEGDRYPIKENIWVISLKDFLAQPILS